MFRQNVDSMKKIPSITVLAFFVIIFASCAPDSEYIANLPKINGFKVKKIYRLNSNILATYVDTPGNRLVFKLIESSATWKRILFKTKVSL